MNLTLVRSVKVAMVAMVALFATFVAFGNLVDYDSNYQFVKHVLSMDTTFEGNALMWRAITSPVLITLGYWFIIAVELAVAVFAWMSTVKMLKALKKKESDFDAAKKWGYVAFILAFVLWFVGFIVVGSEWFAMWQSGTWNGKQTAMDITEVLLGFLIVYMLPEKMVAGK